MTQEHDDEQALQVLRGIWTAQRQRRRHRGAAQHARVCKNMKNIGFGGIAEGGADADSTADRSRRTCARLARAAGARGQAAPEPRPVR